MKVLMTVDAVGGIWTYALALCRALADHGVEVILASMGPQPAAEQRSAALRSSNVRLYSSDYRLEWMPSHDNSTWEDVDRAGEWLLALAEAHDVDLVHLNGYSHATLHWERPVLVVAHSCVLSWWQAVHETDAPEEWNEYRSRVTRGIAAAAAVVAPSRFMLDEVVRLYGAPRDARVIRNAIDVPPLTPGGAAPAPEDGQRQSFILACGRMWDEAKNLRVLDEAAIGLPWPVYIAGPTAFAGQGGVRCRAAVPLGQLAPDCMAGWLRRASIFAHPCLYEPFGLAPLEAALAGCALVLGDVPSLRELWGDAATFVETRDPDALHDALLELMAKPQLRRRMARAARVRSMGLSPGRMAAEYASLYEQLIANLALSPEVRARATRSSQNSRHPR